MTYTTATGIEFTKFTGSGNFDVIAGNSVNQTIIGGTGNDTIESGAGATLIGGKGDDTYILDSAFETITENVNEGKDTVETSLNSYTLGANLENLTHTAGTPFTGTGNTLDNVITGGGGANTLSGLDGNDRLISGGGVDTLIGGKGDDVYIDAGAHCTITELAGEGIDTLATTLNTETPRRQRREPILYWLRRVPRDWQCRQ